MVLGTALLPKNLVPNLASLTILGCSLEKAGSSVRPEILGFDFVRCLFGGVVVYLTHDVRFDNCYMRAMG